jgi:hypothetical protein
VRHRAAAQRPQQRLAQHRLREGDVGRGRWGGSGWRHGLSGRRAGQVKWLAKMELLRPLYAYQKINSTIFCIFFFIDLLDENIAT